MARKFVINDVFSGSGTWVDEPDLPTKEQTIAQMFGSASALTPIGTPELTSNGVYSAPFYKVNTAQGLKYFTPAFGKENGREIQTGGGEGGGISYGWEGNGGYDIAPWNNWSNGTYWMPQTDGMQTVNAPWAADLVKNLPYQGGMEYTGGGWVSDTPPGYRTWQQEPETSALTQFMQGPMIPLAGFLGAGALAGLGAAGGAGAAATGTGVGGAIGAGSALGGGALGAAIGTGLGGVSGGGSYLGAGAGGLADWGVNSNSGGGMDDELGGFWDLINSSGGNAADIAGQIGQASVQGGSNGPGLMDTITNYMKQNPGSALRMLGQLGAAGLGAVGSSQQTNALNGLANQYLNMGAPYRGLLAASYADPAGYLANSPDIKASVDQGTNAMARALSTTGNPAQSGRTLQELQNYATQGLYGQLGNARNSLANYGGLSAFNQAAPATQMQSIGSNANLYNALGYGLQQVTAPPQPSLTDLYKAFGLTGLP